MGFWVKFSLKRENLLIFLPSPNDLGEGDWGEVMFKSGILKVLPWPIFVAKRCSSAQGKIILGCKKPTVLDMDLEANKEKEF